MLGRALLVAALFVPGVVGQELLGPALEFELLDVPTAPVKPEIESPSFRAVATLRCDILLAVAEPGPDPKAFVDVAFDVQHQVGIAGTGRIEVDGASCLAPGATHATSEQTFQMVVPRTAPGLEAIPGVATARLVGGPSALPPEPPVDVAFQVTADYYSLNQVRMATKLQQCSPGESIDFPAEVANLGNARTVYDFGVAAQPGGDWRIRIPQTLILEAPREGASPSAAIVFQVTCTGLNSEGAFQITITPAAADDPSKQGNPLTANFLARSRGVIPAPGPGPLVGILLLGLAVLAGRHP